MSLRPTLMVRWRLRARTLNLTTSLMTRSPLIRGRLGMRQSGGGVVGAVVPRRSPRLRGPLLLGGGGRGAIRGLQSRS
jgi:hypothetical protein